MASTFTLLLLFLSTATLFHSSAIRKADDNHSNNLFVDESDGKLLSAEDLFAVCQRKYSKTYFSTEEYHYRFWVFKNNLADAQAHRRNRFIPRPLTESCDLTANEPHKPSMITREHCMKRAWYMPDERDFLIWRERYGVGNDSTLPPLRKHSRRSFPVINIGSV